MMSELPPLWRGLGGRRMALPDPQLQPEFYDWVPAKRLLAWAIDAVVTLVLSFAALVVLVLWWLGPAGLLAWMLVALPLSVAYRTVMIARYGGTVGMLIAAIRLWRLDGTRPDRRVAFLHSAIYVFGTLFALPQLLSMVLMATGHNGRGLGDYICGTAMLNQGARH